MMCMVSVVPTVSMVAVVPIWCPVVPRCLWCLVSMVPTVSMVLVPMVSVVPTVCMVSVVPLVSVVPRCL